MMLCRNPYTAGTAAYPCGQCMPCRFNRRRIWSHRILLEAYQHSDNCFATLTYSDENIPLAPNGRLTLQPDDLTRWLKRFRKEIAPHTIRYYAVGEYGTSTERPHYHVALFGFPTCRRGLTYIPRSGAHCCAVCDLVGESWNRGNIVLGQLNPSTASYVAGYVTKKMTAHDDSRLDGRHPEFARMSLRPGIAADALHEVASELMTYGFDTSEDDVPLGLRHGRKVLPLGRYLRRKLRLLVGRDEDCPDVVLDKMAQELSPMYEAAFATPRARGTRENFFRSLLIDVDKDKVSKIEARQRIFKERRPL